MRAVGRLGVLFVVFAGLGAACGRSSAEKVEADRVSRAVDQLRNAENEQKRHLLARLRSVDCERADVCAVKETCVRAYESHVAAVEATAAASRTIRADAGGERAAAGVLSRAVADLADAKKKADDCVDRQAQLKRKYDFD